MMGLQIQNRLLLASWSVVFVVLGPRLHLLCLLWLICTQASCLMVLVLPMWVPSSCILLFLQRLFVEGFLRINCFDPFKD
jgi:hypothetical protein